MSRLGELAVEFGHELHEFDPALSSGAECAALAEQLARIANACSVASARAAQRAAECGRVSEPPAEFLARVGGATARRARAMLAAVDAVEARSETRTALLAGEVSVAQAAAIASVAPEHEAELLEIARAKSLGPVSDRARKHRLAAMDPVELHAKQVAAQHVHTWTTEIGNVGFAGELPPETGVAFAKRLAVETDRAWRAATKEERNRPREWHSANAFATLFSSAGAGKSRTADVVIVCDINAYRRGRALPGEPCHIVGGSPIPVSLARELAKDAFLKAVLHDGVAIHTIAHLGRYRPAVLQTALDLGPVPEFDGVTCTDCGRRYNLEWDHVDPVANDGPTSYDNLDPRCPPCHDAKTERDRLNGLLRAKLGPRGP